MNISLKSLAVLLIVLSLAAASAALGFLKWSGRHQPAAYRTAVAKRGDIQMTISATGTVEPEEVVDVGAQVLGRIESRGRERRIGRGQHERNYFVSLTIAWGAYNLP